MHKVWRKLGVTERLSSVMIEIFGASGRITQKTNEG